MVEILRERRASRSGVRLSAADVAGVAAAVAAAVAALAAALAAVAAPGRRPEPLGQAVEPSLWGPPRDRRWGLLAWRVLGECTAVKCVIC